MDMRMTARDEQMVRARALLSAAQRGEAAAQTELFNAYKQQVARQIQRMTGDPTTVDDLVQEVFIAAFSALPGFRGDAQLQTWLYSIAANKVRNWWESQRRRQARETKAGMTLTDDAATPEEGAETAEHRRRLYTALGSLPDKLREAFTARAIEGRSLREVSDLMGVPVSTVSYRTRRAEELLCKALDLRWSQKS
jgi:RNA polymerase sigma-70 factor (ECF subfamily)